MKHNVAVISNVFTEDFTKNFIYAVMWKDIIVCICSNNEWAEQIAKTLDDARPYLENE